MSGKRFKKKPETKKNKKIFVKIIFIIFILIMIYTGMQIFNWFKENKVKKF